MPSRPGANIWGCLFKYPHLFHWRIFRSPYFWHDSFGAYFMRWVGCPLFGHKKVNDIDDMGGGPSRLHCFACESKVKLPTGSSRNCLYLYIATYKSTSGGIKTENYKLIHHLKEGDKDVANHPRPRAVTLCGSISLKCKRVEFMDLPLYVSMDLTEHGQHLLETLTIK